MSKKSNEAETVQKDVVEAQVPKETEKKPLKLYPFEDFYEHPEVIGKRWSGLLSTIREL